MDVRGIEVTNQLRSAIRAKLLELGVRYDEELPDYILVMVVNKKSRQQMHEDLYLFLEDSTTPFVDWLHDQVLKKLQRVTIAKKKVTKEFVPTVVVKQEDEKKKKKICTSFLEDHSEEQSKIFKEDKSLIKDIDKSPILKQNINTVIHNKQLEKTNRNLNEKLDVASNVNNHQEVTKKIQGEQSMKAIEKCDESKDLVDKSKNISTITKSNSGAFKNLKRPFEKISDFDDNLNADSDKEDLQDEQSKRLKSSVNKPKITSVVSVKNRLGITSTRKKFEVYRSRMENERFRGFAKNSEKRSFNINRRLNPQHNKSFDSLEIIKKDKIHEKSRETVKSIDIKSRLGTNKNGRLNRNTNLKVPLTQTKQVERLQSTVKSRLGVVSSALHKEIPNRILNNQNNRGVKYSKHEINENTGNSIKQRLGPLRDNHKPVLKFVPKLEDSILPSSEDEECSNFQEEDVDDSFSNSGPIRSHIIAVNKPVSNKVEKRQIKNSGINIAVSKDEEEDMEETKIPSKVIVTPRPLKPLQPIQKRATQSLLLKAIAEANQSVVTQKNPEPLLLEKKTKKQPATLNRGEMDKNLSVRLNASKRLVIENIQVELSTNIKRKMDSESYVKKSITEDHMGVVKSLFQRSDNNPQFLVTLNGYNNNLMKNNIVSDEEAQFEMEENANVDDEFSFSTTQNDTFEQNETIEDNYNIIEEEEEVDSSEKERSDENNENCNVENIDAEENIVKKRRKLSPIIYNRTNSPKPVHSKSIDFIETSSSVSEADKKPVSDTVVKVIDKSREKCRYWPNCTLGNKCAYFHPVAACSTFPACKFGDKCLYKHPKCKYGLSCTKLGCVFSHPSQQCKYHPFCTKPNCSYSHPTTANKSVTVDSSNQRAKFTWRRKD